MKKQLLLFCILFPFIFFMSCNAHQNSPVNISPINQILKTKPVKITISSWIEYVKDVELRMETEQEAISAFNNPNNWIMCFEITDADKINAVMAALSKPAVEPFSKYMLPIGDKICFEDKNGDKVWTSINMISVEKRVYLGDKICGQETYEVLAKFLYENKP